MPAAQCADIREVAALATYGWGVIPVLARTGAVTFETSLFPKDGGFLVPLKAAVRRPLSLSAGDDVTMALTVHRSTR